MYDPVGSFTAYLLPSASLVKWKSLEAGQMELSKELPGAVDLNIIMIIQCCYVHWTVDSEFTNITLIIMNCSECWTDRLKKKKSY